MRHPCPPEIISNRWFSVQRDGNEAYAHFFGEVGIGAGTAEDFVDELGDAKKIHVNLNTVGGDSDQAWAIHDALASKDVSTAIVGRCYSAGIPIFLSGSDRQISSAGCCMIHPPRTWILGCRSELENAAARIGTLNERLHNLLVEKTGQPESVVAGWMDGGDHYLTPAEVVTAGLAHEIFTPRSTPATSTTLASPSASGPTSDERFFYDLLAATGILEVRSRERFGIALGEFFCHNVKEV